MTYSGCGLNFGVLGVRLDFGVSLWRNQVRLGRGLFLRADPIPVLLLLNMP